MTYVSSNLRDILFKPKYPQFGKLKSHFLSNKKVCRLTPKTGNISFYEQIMTEVSRNLRNLVWIIHYLLFRLTQQVCRIVHYIERARLDTFRGFDTERARLGTFNKNFEIFTQNEHLPAQRFFS